MNFSLKYPRTQGIRPPGGFIIAVGVLIALWCAGFAAVSIWFEATGRFTFGPYAADAKAISVINWYVAAVKFAGIVVALLAIVQPPRVLGPRLVSTLLWAAFATVGTYVAGSLAQMVFMLAAPDSAVADFSITAGAYVLAFLFAATGFGVLAFSYRRRAGLGKWEIIVGAFGAPVVLGSVLIVVPELLRAAGMLSR